MGSFSISIMLIDIKNNKYIFFSNISTYEEELLDKHLSVANPKNRYVADLSNRALWDGVYRYYHRGYRRAPRTMLGMVIKLLVNKNIPFDIVDSRPEDKTTIVDANDINTDFLPGISLMDYQVEAIRKATKSEVGIFDIPTGGGKTEIIAGICKAISAPQTIILADQIIIVRQIKERLDLRDIADVGVFYAGKRPSGQTIVVGSPVSLVLPKPPVEPEKSDPNYKRKLKAYETKIAAFKTRKKNAKILQEYVKRSDLIIVDECDRASSETHKYIFKYLYNGRRRYGFSGTPVDPDKPVQEYRMISHLGSVIYKQDRQNLENLNRILPFTYRMIVVDGNIHDARTYDSAQTDFLVENVSLHNMISALCLKHRHSEATGKNGILVLVDRDPFGENLKLNMLARGLTAEFIHGKTSKSKNKETIEAFQRREIDVLIGGKIIGRGLDLKGGCEYLIDLTCGKSTSEFIQRMGRAVRLNKLGRAIVYGMFYRCNKHFYSHSKKKLNIVLDMGYPVEVYHKFGMISGQDLKNRNYRFPSK